MKKYDIEQTNTIEKNIMLEYNKLEIFLKNGIHGNSVNSLCNKIKNIVTFCQMCDLLPADTYDKFYDRFAQIVNKYSDIMIK